jgi:hypothetical protein
MELRLSEVTMLVTHSRYSATDDPRPITTAPGGFPAPQGE